MTYLKIINRNYAIDSLRLICAFFVVFLHCNYKSNNVFIVITRTAVPIFFMISGYFLFQRTTFDFIEKSKKNILKASKIFLFSTAFFFFFKETISLYQYGNFYIPSLKDWVAFILFNENPFSYHLWYISANLYVLFFLFFLRKYNLLKQAFYLIPILLTANLMFGKYSLFFFNRDFTTIFIRNFLFTGLPFTLLGCYIRSKQKNIQAIGVKTKITFFVISIALTVLENYLIAAYSKSNGEIFFSTVFLSVSFFVLFLSSSKKEQSVVSRYGKKYSLMIYIIHPCFIFFFAKKIEGLFPSDFFTSITTFIFSLVFAVAYEKAKIIIQEKIFQNKNYLPPP